MQEITVNLLANKVLYLGKIREHIVRLADKESIQLHNIAQYRLAQQLNQYFLSYSRSLSGDFKKHVVNLLYSVGKELKHENTWSFTFHFTRLRQQNFASHSLSPSNPSNARLPISTSSRSTSDVQNSLKCPLSTYFPASV